MFKSAHSRQSKLFFRLKPLEKGALIKNEFAKKEGTDSHSFYNLTDFGEDVLNGLMDTLAVPRSAGEPIEPLKKLKEWSIYWENPD